MYRFACSVWSVFLLLILFAFVSCVPTVKQSTSQSAFRKLTEDKGPFATFSIYHFSDDSSRVYFAFNSDALLYVKNSVSGAFESRVSINYSLTPDWESKQIIDSGSVYFTDTVCYYGKGFVYGSFVIKSPVGQTGFVRISLFDLNRLYSEYFAIRLDKSSKGVRQDFLLRDSTGAVPVFRNFLQSAESAKVSSRLLNKGAKVFVSYYRREFPLPPPPFSTQPNKPFRYEADSSFMLTADEDSSIKLSFPARGFYHLRLDTSLRDGFTIFRREDDAFPEFKSVESLIPPMRYLSSRQEYDDILYATNKKKAFDDFWLKNAGLTDRAKQLVKSYYSRARYANYFFSSHVEGWRSDRGLIYMVFGEPNVVYRDWNSETWVYGEEKSYSALSLVFMRVVNPFSDNDFQLTRSEMLKDEWYKSVDTWRQGRVFNDRP